MATTTAIKRPAQLSQGSCQSLSVKSTRNGSTTSAAKFQTYIHTREALFRLIATYPPRMSFVEAVERARVDFTRGRKEVAL